MKKMTSLCLAFSVSGVTSSYATNDKTQIEKIFRSNMDISYACPSEKQHREAYEIVTRNIANLAGTRDPALTKLKAAEPLLRKAVIFKVKDSDELKSHEVESYLSDAKEQIQRCKELSFLLTNLRENTEPINKVVIHAYNIYVLRHPNKDVFLRYR